MGPVSLGDNISTLAYSEENAVPRLCSCSSQRRQRGTQLWQKGAGVIQLSAAGAAPLLHLWLTACSGVVSVKKTKQNWSCSMILLFYLFYHLAKRTKRNKVKINKEAKTAENKRKWLDFRLLKTQKNSFTQQLLLLWAHQDWGDSEHHSHFLIRLQFQCSKLLLSTVYCHRAHEALCDSGTKCVHLGF